MCHGKPFPVKLLGFAACLVLVAGLVLPGTAAATNQDWTAALALHAASPRFTELEAAAREAAGKGTDPVQLGALLRGVHEGNVPTDQVIAWVEHAARISEAGLPVSPVVSRYLQGVAKGVPAVRIEGAVRELEIRLAEAARRVDASGRISSTPAARNARLIAIDHAAYVLGLGVPSAQIEHLLALVRKEGAPIEAAQAPVLTLGILVASGIPAEQSLVVLDAAWIRGYRGEDLERLGKAVGGLGREGKVPSAGLVDRVVALIDQEGSRDQVFQGLQDLILREGGTSVPPIGVSEDPSLHRGDPPKPREPSDTPAVGGEQRPMPGED